jgi:hypothetical protein
MARKRNLGRRSVLKGTAGFAGAAIAPPAALALVSDNVLGGRGDYFIYRNVIVATVPLTIAAATVVATPRAGRLGAAVVVVACVLLTAVSVESPTCKGPTSAQLPQPRKHRRNAAQSSRMSAQRKC